MTYRGHIERGTVILDEPASLPEGGKVLIELLTAPQELSIHPDVLRVSGIFPRQANPQNDYYEALAEKHQERDA